MLGCSGGDEGGHVVDCILICCEKWAGGGGCGDIVECSGSNLLPII